MKYKPGDRVILVSGTNQRFHDFIYTVIENYPNNTIHIFRHSVQEDSDWEFVVHVKNVISAQIPGYEVYPDDTLNIRIGEEYYADKYWRSVSREVPNRVANYPVRRRIRP